ncbi:hypothetical protein P152DRAFT_435795 [Eremomyces bilateralis CBS 781.70]|uniref:VLRF1 domain-containing protein n=1 Tax=Eremomyces bilateralis CBS 781.70 TaxID=1392243 RepID=A0A6G1G3F9_9PEZI|nr:uncharacterized protein P152DRAFT_435795 [Eremomyces bilateralis CBS 781.70]KAF1812548.1 hypothetical protein P152DRAFT_435795 [Eremomyces bilateralis CBS 781.70]
MASPQSSRQDDLVRRHLYLFDLPKELLETLTLASTYTAVSPTTEYHPKPKADPLKSEAADQTIKSTSCGLCSQTFANLQEQREHVRSDYHRYNLKRKIKAQPAITEAEFDRLIGDLDESISGSESDESDAEEQEEADKTRDNLSLLLKKQAKISPESSEDSTNHTVRLGKQPVIWFSSKILPADTKLSVYRAVFSQAEQDEPSHLVDTIRRKQLEPKLPPKKPKSSATPSSADSPTYFLCMIGGGHFAGMVVSLRPKPSGAKTHTGAPDRHATVLAHKTFHRYTTRRKQGGGQSSNDAAKGAAHSAGSSLRRYNEAALIAEIRALLVEWKPMIDAAELLFVRAAGTANRATLFGEHHGQAIRRDDPRIRGFPFSTRRATQGELMRAFVEVTKAKVAKVEEEPHRDQLAGLGAPQRKQSPSRKPAPEKKVLSEEEQMQMHHTTQIASLIRRARAPALLSYLSSNSLDADYNLHPDVAIPGIPSHQRASLAAPLHLASKLSIPAIVSALLVKGNSNPTTRNADGKTAAQLASDRATKDAFRIARAEIGETKWNWDAAAVGAPLSKAEVVAQVAREKAEAEAEETERRKVEMDRIEQEREEEGRREREREGARWGRGSTVAGKAVGKIAAGRNQSGQERREEEMRGMDAQMRMRVERERRARAAEERMRRLQGDS